MIPVLILAGGLGTRLKSVVPNLPKPLADINGKPFLWWLLTHLENEGAKDIYLSVGYLHEHIQVYFGKKFNQLTLHYIIEKEPLGTGGAIKNACKLIPQEKLLILNGDTLALFNLRNFIKFSEEYRSQLFLSVINVENASRYGTVLVNDNNQITDFIEKGKTGDGLINAGIYLLNKSVFNLIDLPEKFSFESDFLAEHIHKLNLIAYNQVSDFIDIGIPEDLSIAQKKIPAMILGA